MAAHDLTNIRRLPPNSRLRHHSPQTRSLSSITALPAMRPDENRHPKSDNNQNSSSSNIFIRFKQRVDAHITAGLDAVFSGPRSPAPSGPYPPTATPTTAHPTSSSNSSSPSPNAMPDSSKDAAVTDVDVYDISSSSYSPLALRSLRQPIPNDLPPHLDARVFTFQDAFEDLLAVSQGRSLPDIQTRYDQSRILRQMYPNGEPAFLWLRRLESQGLASRPRGFHIFAPPTSDWDAFEKDVEKGVKDFWDGIAKDIKENPSTRDALEKASKVFKQLDEKYTDDKSRSSQQDPASQNKPKTRPPADTFDDLYSSIKSSFTETQKAWDTFKKVMAEDVPARAKELERDVKKRAEEFSNDISRRAEEMGREQEARRRRDIKVNDKQTETREEYVDLFGYKHTTVRRKTYDDDGNEIGSSVEVTVRPVEKKEGEGEGGGAQNNELDNKSATGNGTTNKRGWLWKKGD